MAVDIHDFPDDLGPIPGQSLTEEPGGPAWERPPQHAKLEDALMAYVEKFDEPEVQEVMLTMLDNKVPLDLLVNFVVRGSTLKGVHTVEAGMLLKPMIHEYMSLLASEAGIEVVETAADLNKEERQKAVDDQLIAAYSIAESQGNVDDLEVSE